MNFTKYVRSVCALLKDVNIKVQEVGMDTIMEMYTLEGERIHEEVCKCNIPAAKLKLLKRNFEAVDSGRWSRSRVRSCEDRKS